MDNLAGQSIKGYELQERIAAGGFGAIYRAYQSTVGREVAVKVILPGLANQPDFIRRFETEAQLIARLEHMHIVPLHDYWRDPDGAFLVMRYLRGGSLRDQIARQGALSLEETLHLFAQIVQGLHVAHRNQVVHRDIKPANILLDEDGNGYLADFGIAKVDTVTQHITEPDRFIGSIEYLAPEQARSELVTPQTDIYSLGVVLYEMLVGAHPFPNTDKISIIYKHLNDPLPGIFNLEDNVREDINAIIQQATAKDPRQRFDDVLKMMEALRQAAHLDMTPTPTSVVELLTPREQEVMQLIIDGKSNREIADMLVLAETTVKSYITSIYRKLHVRSRVQAIARARDLDFVVKKPDSRVSLSTGSLPEPENPYKGLRAFQVADSQDFFGRETLTQKLITLLQETVDHTRFLAVVGPSGSGKSSVVKAGLIPALWRGDLPGSEHWYIVDMLPGYRPLDELEVALLRVIAEHDLNLREQLERDTHGLVRAANLILPDDDSELLIVIDQFEEVFTLLDREDERRHFLSLLRAAVIDERSRVRVVVTLRADYYGRPLQYPDFGQLLRSRVETVLPLSAEELEYAIHEPARRVGVMFEDGLISRVVSDVHYQPGALPLLQYALTELFERRAGHSLTFDAYREIGGAGGALAKRADELYQEQDEIGREHIRQLFLHLVTLGEGTEDTRRRVARAELLDIAVNPEHMDELIDLYAESRLLSLDHNPATRQPVVEVAHEAILREWGRLRQWLHDSREDILQERGIAQAAAEWQANEQDSSYLLSGTRLEQAEAWHEITDLALTPVEHDFLLASIQSANAQAIAEVERQSREAAQQQRSRSLLRVLVAVFALATVVSTSFGLFALNRQNVAATALDDAQNERDRAQLAASTSQSLLLAASARDAARNGHTDLALRLAVEANMIAGAPYQAQTTLSDLAFTTGTRRIYEGHHVPVLALGISPDRRYIVSGGGNAGSSDPGDVRLFLWDFETGDTMRSFEGHTATVWRAEFSPDGRRILSTSEDGTIRLWDVATGTEIRQFDARTFTVTAAFSPDGRYILSGGDDSIIRLWNTETGAEIRQFDGPTTRIISDGNPVFSPDGATALTGHFDGTLIVWDVPTGTAIRRFEHAAPIVDIALSPDGKIAATGLVDGTLWLWDMESDESIHHLVDGHTESIAELAFSPDSQLIASGAGDGLLILWDVETGTVVQILSGHEGGITNLVFTADGEGIITSSNDGTLRLWDLFNPLEFSRFEAHQDQVHSIAIRPNSETVISASGRALGTDQVIDESIRAWNLATGAEGARLEGHQDGILAVALSPDGTRLLSASDDAYTGSAETTLLLRDAQNGNIIRALVGHIWYAHHIAFTSDGRRAFSQGVLATVLWDLDTGDEIRRFVRSVGQSFPDRGINFAVSPDDQLLVITFRDGAVIFWDVETGQQIRHYGADGEGHTASVQSVAFSPDGRTLLTGGDDETLILWDVEAGAVIRRLEGHSGPVTTIQYSPDGHTALSGSSDTSLIWWDLDSGDVIRRFQGHTDTVNDVVFHEMPDGSLVALSASADTSVIVWKLFTQSRTDLVEWVYKNRHVRNLTCTEQEQFRIEPGCDNQTLEVSAPPESTQLAATARAASSAATLIPTATPMTASRIAQVGENQGEIAVGGGERWLYEGQSGEILTILVHAQKPANGASAAERFEQGLLDTFLMLRHPDGSLLTLNDDAYPPLFPNIDSFTTDSGIAAFELPVDGSYQIVVRSILDSLGGAYTLVIQSRLVDE